MSEIEAKTQYLQPVKHPVRGSVVVITPEIKSGDLEFDSQARPWIFHLLLWVSISVPEDLYIYIYVC